MVSVHDKEEIKIFLDELDENLNYLDDSIISLEKNPGNQETLEDIFRVAHTIKGSAGFLDLQNLVALGHAMENVFQEFKSGGVAVGKAVIDTLLECKDAIYNIGQLLGKGEDTTRIKTDALIARVNQFVKDKKTGGAPAKATPVDQSLKPADGEFSPQDFIPGAQLVRVWISASELAPSIRAFLVSKRLAERGEIIQQKPSEEEMDAEDFELPADREIRYWIKSESPLEEIESAAKADLIDKVSVLPEEILKAMISFSSEQSEENEVKTQKADIETSDSVRIPVQTLDIMLNLVGELVIANSGFNQIQETLRNLPELQNLFKDVRDRAKDLTRISAEIQTLVMESRLVPISQVFNRFRRFIRDYSSKSGKKINFTMSGESTELDKKITDEIIKPLTHIVRNSLDHGLELPEERLANGKSETGTLHLESYQEGNYINIIIKDDGRGLNYDKIIQKAIEKLIITPEEALTISDENVKNLIFHSGFSTKDAIDEMSGRGVGMDVVKSSVEELNGSIIIDSEPNEGTILTIKLPLTLAILNALIVKVGSEKYCIPMSSIIETQKVDAKNFLTVDNNEMVKLRDKLIPTIRLEKIFPASAEGADKEPEKQLQMHELKRSKRKMSEEHPVIVVDYHGTPVAILVDQFLSRQEVVIKSLSEHYRTIEGISGASILGDGSIILIIDVHGVIQLFRAQRSKTFGDITTISPIARMGKTQPDTVKTPLARMAPKIIPKIVPPAKEKKDISLTNLSSMSPEEFEMLEDVDFETPQATGETGEGQKKQSEAGEDEYAGHDIIIYPKSKDTAPVAPHAETIEDEEMIEEDILSYEDIEIFGDDEEESPDLKEIAGKATPPWETKKIPDATPEALPGTPAKKSIEAEEDTFSPDDIDIFDGSVEEPAALDEGSEIETAQPETAPEAEPLEMEPLQGVAEEEAAEETQEQKETGDVEIFDEPETDAGLSERILKGDAGFATESTEAKKAAEEPQNAMLTPEPGTIALEEDDGITEFPDTEPAYPGDLGEDTFEFSVSPDDTVTLHTGEKTIDGSTEQRLQEGISEEQAIYDESPHRLSTAPNLEVTIEEIEEEMTEMENYKTDDAPEPAPAETPVTPPVEPPVEEATPEPALEEKPVEEKGQEGGEETTQEPLPEMSEFERMKMMIETGAVDENSTMYQSIALSHFNKDDYQMEKLHDFLDGKNPEMVRLWLKNGNERAIEGIKSLTGRTNITPGQTRAKKYTRDKLNVFIERYRGDDLPVVGLALPILPIQGMLYFILTHNSAQNMAAMLYQTAQMTPPEVIDFEPLMEVTNILGSAFTNTLTQITDIPIEPGLPEILENNELLIESMNEHLKKSEEKSILYIENEFLWGDKEVLAELVMMIPKII